MADLVLDDLSQDAKTIIAYVQFEFDKMKAELTATVNAKNHEIQSLKAEVSELKTKVTKLESLVDESDAYERRDTLIFSGPSIPVATRDENCSTIIQNLLKNELKHVISPNDISTAHRLGKKAISQTPDRRSLIVKFCRRDVKHQIFAARKAQPRDARLYVNESLTPGRQNVYHTLRKIRRSNPDLIAGVSTYDGRVYAYTKNESGARASSTNRDQRHLINNVEMLNKFCDEFLKRPLQAFLNSFGN